jgi:hypothetical protein
MPAERIECLIRGMTPWPGAYTFSDGMRLKIFKACVLERDISVPPGTILECFPGELRVATGHRRWRSRRSRAHRANACPSTIFSAAAVAGRPLSGLTGRARTSPRPTPPPPGKPTPADFPTQGRGADRTRSPGPSEGPWTPFSMMPPHDDGPLPPRPGPVQPTGIRGAALAAAAGCRRRPPTPTAPEKNIPVDSEHPANRPVPDPVHGPDPGIGGREHGGQPGTKRPGRQSGRIRQRPAQKCPAGPRPV